MSPVAAHDRLAVKQPATARIPRRFWLSQALCDNNFPGKLAHQIPISGGRQVGLCVLLRLASYTARQRPSMARLAVSDRLHSTTRGSPYSSPSLHFGRTQLSLVEHALCPLDAGEPGGGPFVHQTQYYYSDKNRHRKEARVQVTCPYGLSPMDELYLWGLLSLTFSQTQPTPDFYATPYYCLRQLGYIAPEHDRHGGKQFALFRSSMRRLSAVSYQNDHFYDPVRGEHRDVSFGFFSYSLPLDPKSSRAWRLAWDPIFFELCQATAGALRFDFPTYRSLDAASRRLYLLLKKIFWRNAVSPEFDLDDLAVHVLGFSATHPVRELKRKVRRCAEVLLAYRIISLPNGVADLRTLFVKRSAGNYAVRFHRGPYFLVCDSSTMAARIADSPLYEPLSAIGLDEATIRRVLRAHDPRLVAECADMTLAAKERHGDNFFTKSPPAYFIDNLREQAAGRRTPPDWWRELRKEEERRRWQADDGELAASSEQAFAAALDAYLMGEAREAFGREMDRIFQDLRLAGHSDADAKQHADRLARPHFVNRFRAEHPEWNDAGPSRLADSATR